MTDNRWFVRSILTIGLVLIGLIPAVATAQEATTVSGQVKSTPGGAPLSGAIVSIPSLRVNATTDNAGKYRLVLPAGSSGAVQLTVRRIGYQTSTVPVTLSGASVEQDIALVEGAIELQQVVVTALGIERESRSLPFAAQTISGERLSDVPTQNVVSSLGGKVAGVQVTNSSNPFGSARIVVRGASSILGQNQPLIVVDGIPIDNSAPSNDGYGGGSLGGYDVGNAASDISADNIASVTVLKGPNAAALYGSRAANGAIVYTTKSGKGAPSQGFGVTATFGANMETPLRLPDYQNKYGQGFYGEFDFVDGNFSGVNDGADESWGPKLDGRTTGCIYVTDSLGNPNYAAGYNQSHPCNQFFGAGPWQAHPNNVRDFWNTGLIINANVAVARSSDRSNVRLSVGRTNESGMYPNNTNDRTDIALSGGTQVSNHWSAEASVNYIRDGMQNQPSQAYEEIDPMQGFIWFGRQVDVSLLKNNIYRDPNDPLTQQILAGTTRRSPYLRTDAPLPYSWNYSYHPSPYWMTNVKTTDYGRNRGLGHAAVTYKFNDWISVTGRTGRDWYQNQFRANYPVNDISPYGQGGLLDVGETRSETNNDFLITANRTLTPTLSLTVNAGGNQRINDFNTNLGQVGELVIPGVYTLANSNGSPSVGLFVSHKKVNSLYGSASFNFKDWLNVDITGRNDWSSTLPKNGNSLFYPSIGAAFVFTDALKLQSSLLSYGKLRASWTRVGNDTDPYQLAAVYGGGTAWAGQPSYTAPDRLPNASLKPEQTTGEEIGADLGFFRDKLIVNATIYQKSTTNQILPVSISPATGYSSAVVNSGEVRNRGFEIAATMTPIERPDFRWNVVVNWSKNTNKVLSLYGGVSRIVVGSYWNVNVTADSGQPYGNLVGYKWQRDAQGHIVVGSDGLPLRDPTQQVLGNYNPDWVGGISNTISYKRMSFSFSFDGQVGGHVYSVTKWFGQYSGVLAATLLGRENNWNDSMVVANSVYANGQPNTTKVLAQDYWHNTFYAQEPGIFDATFFKLREARLAYALPPSVSRFLGFSDATVAIVGRNLLLFAKQPTIDPETAFDTSNRQGVENGQLPTARSIGFTMSVRP
jgi:TonB-linked SusC/RagA family outer membrane protein